MESETTFDDNYNVLNGKVDERNYYSQYEGANKVFAIPNCW